MANHSDERLAVRQNLSQAHNILISILLRAFARSVSRPSRPISLEQKTSKTLHWLA
jgi:hypothetical protein